LMRDPLGRVRIDPTGHGPGRGAYLHRTEGCVREGFRGSSLAGALRVRLDPAQAARLMDDALKAAGETR
jgi:predicted RNA-binding protein YlxR (DUF448 family)